MSKLWKLTITTKRGVGEIYLSDSELLQYIQEVTESGGVVNGRGEFIEIIKYEARRFQ